MGLQWRLPQLRPQPRARAHSYRQSRRAVLGLRVAAQSPRDVQPRLRRSGGPIVATTVRLTEHYLSGPMSRFNSWLNELQPEMFVEISPELAAEKGIEHAGWLTVRSPRGTIEARAMVTKRVRPYMLNGKVVHQ